MDRQLMNSDFVTCHTDYNIILQWHEFYVPHTDLG